MPNLLDKLDEEGWAGFGFGLNLDEDDSVDGLEEEEQDKDVFFLSELDFEEEASDF